MSTGREAHQEACAFAVAETEALSNRIMAAREKLSEQLHAVVNATGDQPAGDSARAAYEWSSALGEHLDRAIDMAENIKGQLIQYQAGW